MRARLAASLALACLLPGCAVESQDPAAWAVVGGDALTQSQRDQLARATGARDALLAALGGRLQTALSEGSPVEAISVCKQDAPRIAAEVSAAQGVSIGRTSQRLRNPGNVGPAWAADHVASAAEEQACFAGPDGELGVLLPIRTMSLCVSCHGPAQGLDEEVIAALAAEYPRDKAVGYREGELRGWFWVEVGP